MNTAMTHRPHTAIRPVLALLLTLLFLVGAAPARAAEQQISPTEPVQAVPQPIAPPADGDDVTPPEPEPTPEPEPDPLPHPAPYFELEQVCHPAGFVYDLAGDVMPDDDVTGEWRESPDGPIYDLGAATSGEVLSGNGTFEIRATVVRNHELIHTVDWTTIVVDCDTHRPEVTIDLIPECTPHAGIRYDMDLLNAPEGDYVYELEWREHGDGEFHTVVGRTGFIASGEGHFDVRGSVYDDEFGPWETEIVEVIVDCHDETPVDPPIVVRPNFTG